MSNSRATKRTAAAAAGLCMVLASFAGAAASATAATHHSPATTHRITPDINPVAAGITVKATPVDIPLATAKSGTATTLPTVTITDPGIIASTNVVTLTLENQPGQAGFGLTTTAPTVTATGTGVTVTSPAAVNPGNGTITFTVTKTTAGTPATYTVSGATVVGGSTTFSDGFDLGVDVGTTGTAPNENNVAAVAPIALGAITSIIPAAYGAEAPDTAAALFRAAEPNPNQAAAVLASDYEPQDAESANFLAARAGTAILLTDPATLSPAVSSVLSDRPAIHTIYIVGGTSVVSATIETQLTGEGYDVIRLAGVDQYATNQFVVNYTRQNFSTVNEPLPVSYTTEPQYNDTSGSSSATTTASTSGRTAILVSGDIKSYQDGVVSGPFSYGFGFPVILTTPTTLSATALELLTEGDFKQVILLGGPSAVSDAVVGQLTASTESGGAGVTVFRIAGTDASDTSTKLASFLINTVYTDYNDVDGGVTDGGVLIARGSGFQDALAAGPYAGSTGYTPILLTENATTLGAPLTAYLKALASSDGVFAVQAIGGPLSITAAVQQAASAAQFSGLTP